MNDLTERRRPTPNVTSLHALLREYGFFLITFPSDDSLFQAPGGGMVISRTLVSMLSPIGILNWAEFIIARTCVPVVDIVDYWAAIGILQVGLAIPVRAEIYRRGEPERGQGRAEIMISEALDPRRAALLLGKVSVFQRLAQNSFKLS